MDKQMMAALFKTKLSYSLIFPNHVMSRAEASCSQVHTFWNSIISDVNI
jgi:hypothetical protein